MTKATASKSINYILAVRSLLFLLLLLNATPIRAISSSAVKHAIMVNQTLDLVNGLRSAVFPPASDMHYMAWCSHFEKEAIKLAMKCKLDLVPKPGVIHFTSYWALYPDEMVHKVVSQGLEAIRNGRCKPNESHLPCRFFRDLMEAGADRIGCGRADCPNNGFFYYCVTNARSSMEPFNGLVYKKGTPCQMCPISSGYCYRNLCVSHATRTAILAETPSSVITCDVPCVNCGERRSANNSCFCEGPKGFTSEEDCSEGSSSLNCSICRIVGTPCRNGGQEVGGPSDPCRCLCNSDYGGQFCEIPMAQIVGGVVTSLYYYPVGPIPFRDGDRMAREIKRAMVEGINSFCRKNQINYLKCCGSGTRPNSEPFDFVDASTVHVTSPVLMVEDPYKNATFTIYATANGNNGLCRKQTSIPSRIVVVPASVIKKVMEDVAYRGLCCGVRVNKLITYYADHYNISLPRMNNMSLSVG